MTVQAQTHTFQADTKRLLHLMVHSLYTDKEIFLRELISNASDALDKMRIEALRQPPLLKDGETLEIRIDTDPQARTLSIRDNGIGMTRDELVSHIGTIAKSGTRELMQRLKENSEGHSASELIGQFGVGFYSAFMVASKVTITTRRAGEDTATRWESAGEGEYTLEDTHRDAYGTTVTLDLLPIDSEGGIEDFTDQWVLSRIVKRYSDFVTFPIILKVEREEVEKDEQGQPIPDGKKTTVVEDKTLNSMKPIWTRSDVTDEEYAEFYKHISHDWADPMKTMRFRAEGRIEYQTLLFIPSQAQGNLNYHGSEFGLQLYVRRVMIMERCEELLPRYLRFVKGIVDSADLPLNISRQRLQEDRYINQIRKWITRKTLDTLGDIQRDDAEQYLKFWEPFGSVLKEGVADADYKDKILGLLLFASSHDPANLTTLEAYVQRMKSDQKEIFYITGESRNVVEHSPHLEAFKAKDYEVLYLVAPVDEFLVQYVFEFQGKRLKSVGKGAVDLGDENEQKAAADKLQTLQEQFKGVFEFLKEKLDDHIKEVRLSNRLTSSPVCLVGAENDYSPQLARLLQKGDLPKQKRIMELNPDHTIVTKLKERFEKDPTDTLLSEYAELLLGYGLLAEGSPIPNPVRYNQVLANLMTRTL
ncbi:MAG: chaperone protein HtpG [Nitrospirales bacterium]|nr:MAG: chaperone protein HtpG [Nitrospirales bacterium]